MPDPNSTLQLAPESSTPELFNVNHTQYLIDEINAAFRVNIPTIAHLTIQHSALHNSTGFTGDIHYKLPHNSHLCTPHVIASEKYIPQLMRGELQISPSTFTSLIQHQHIPTLEVFLRLMAIAGIRYLDDLLVGDHLGITRSEYEHKSHNFITLKTVHKNVKARFKETQMTILQICKDGTISRPTMYKLLNFIDDTVSMRSIVNFCIATNTPIEDIITIDDYNLRLQDEFDA